MSGGLPGKDGAQTICSGVTESPLTDKFSLLSIRFSNSMRKCSDEIADANDKDLSRKDNAGENRRTDRSSGVDGSLLINKRNRSCKMVAFVINGRFKITAF